MYPMNFIFNRMNWIKQKKTFSSVQVTLAWQKATPYQGCTK